MANVKITELPQVSTVLGTDIVPTVASSATSKITITDFANSLPQVSSSLSASYAPNIYNSDGDLTTNRTVGSGSGYKLTLNPELVFNAPISGINTKYIFNPYNNTTGSVSASLATTINLVDDNLFSFPHGVYSNINLIRSNGSLIRSIGSFSVKNGVTSTVQTWGTLLDSPVGLQAGLITATRNGFSGSIDISQNSTNVITALRVGAFINGGQFTTQSAFTNLSHGILINNDTFTGTVNSMYGIRILDQISHFVSSNVSSSVVNNYYGIRLQSSIGTTAGGPTATIGNYFGIRLSPPTIGATGTISNFWGIYADDSRMSHYYAGNFSIGTTTTGSYKLHVIGNTGISGSLDVTGSVQISNVLTLPPQDPLPSSVATGSIAVSGSGIDCKPYFWNGSSWTSMI